MSDAVKQGQPIRLRRVMFANHFNALLIPLLGMISMMLLRTGKISAPRSVRGTVVVVAIGISVLFIPLLISTIRVRRCIRSIRNDPNACLNCRYPLADNIQTRPICSECGCTQNIDDLAPYWYKHIPQLPTRPDT